MVPSKPQLLHGFGVLIKRRRSVLKLSQDDLADRAELDRTYISGLERGIRNPSLTALLALAHGFDTTLSDMLDGLEREAQAVHD